MTRALDSIVDAVPAGCGPIGLLSSDEFTGAATEFDEALLDAGGKNVALLLCADPRNANASARIADAHFAALGAETRVVDVLDRRDAQREKLGSFDILYLGGGSPADLLACLRDTPLWEEALRSWRAGAAMAGSSAGAMALCRASLEPIPGASLPEQWTRGLGPLEHFGIAAHASSRPSSWLDGIVASAPVPVVALDDATGILLQTGRKVRVLGRGRAWIAGDA